MITTDNTDKGAWCVENFALSENLGDLEEKACREGFRTFFVK